ncbi:MAG: hypothetical protein ACQESN_02545 [Thermotogota bacterium]
MDLYAVLGWINVVLVSISLSYYFVKFYFKKHNFKTKESKIKFAQVIKKISRYHRINGVIILIIATIHAYLILGTIFYWHTGLILFLAIFLNLVVFILGKMKLLKKWLVFHRYIAILIFVFLIIHLTNPWLFG